MRRLHGVWLVLAAAAAGAAAAETAVAPPRETNVFARALILGQEVRSQAERLERFVSDPTVRSDEIDALRKKNDALDLLLSGELTEGDRARLRDEQATVRQNLRAAVSAHPDVRRAAAALAADKARLVELNRQILAIRQARQREAAPAQPGPGPQQP